MICKNCIHFKVCKHKTKAVYACEDFREEAKELTKAIKLLTKQYEKAKRLEWVHSPLAYALYQVWKIEDTKGK